MLFHSLQMIIKGRYIRSFFESRDNRSQNENTSKNSETQNHHKKNDQKHDFYSHVKSILFPSRNGRGGYISFFLTFRKVLNILRYAYILLITQLDTSTREEIQKNLFSLLTTTDQRDERQRDFKDFIEDRDIQEEDYPIIAELYTYPNDKFIRAFHNSLSFEKERSGKMMQSMIEDNKDD